MASINPIDVWHELTLPLPSHHPSPPRSTTWGGRTETETATSSVRPGVTNHKGAETRAVSSQLASPPFHNETESIITSRMALKEPESMGAERRMPACSICRRHKVKCVHSDPNDPNSPCVRCLKGKKECVFDLGGKRRPRLSPTQPTQGVSKHRIGASNASTPTHMHAPPISTPTQIYGKFDYSNPPPTNGIGANIPNGLGTSGPNGINGLNRPNAPNGPNGPNSMGSNVQHGPHPSNGQFSYNVVSGVPDNLQLGAYMSPGGPQFGVHMTSNGSTPVGSGSNMHGSDYGMPMSAAASETSRDSPNFMNRYPNGRAPASHSSSHELSPEELRELVPPIQHSARRHSSINVVEVRDDMINSWSDLTDRDAQRIRLLENMTLKPVNRPENNVIEQGLLSRGEAIWRFNVYRNYIYPHLPMVNVDDLTLDELIEQRPLVFHCVMDIASLHVREPGLQEKCTILHNMAYTAVINEIMVFSNKSLEALQALIIQLFWYNEPEFFHRSKLRALSATALCLAFDLGIGTAQLRPMNTQSFPRYEQIVTPQAVIDTRSLACYKAWLACYCASFDFLSAMRRPVASVWNTYTVEACDFLARQGEKETLKLWKIAQYFRLHEEITLELFRRGNEPVVPDISDASVRYLVKHFDDKIEALKTHDLESEQKHLISYYAIKAYLHQGALYTEFNREVGRSPFTSFSLNLLCDKLSIAAVRSFRTCLTSALSVIRIVLSISVDRLAICPMPIFTQVVFCCALVLKCRALTAFNRVYADVGEAQEDGLEEVMATVTLLDRIAKEYPFTNNVVCLSFVIKLLICHNDAVIQHMITQYAGRPTNFGYAVSPGMFLDPQSRAQPEVAAQSAQASPKIDTAGATSASDPSQSKYDEQDKDLLTVPEGERRPSLRADSVFKTSNLFPSDLDLEGEHPFLQMSDDFWKGMVPDDGVFNFDI